MRNFRLFSPFGKSVTATDVQTFLQRNFSEVCRFCFVKKARFPILSPQSAGSFLKIACKSERFRARGDVAFKVDP